MNVSDIGLLQYKSMLFWALPLVECFLKYTFSETGLVSVIRYEESNLVEPEVETSPFWGAHPSRNFVPDNIIRSSFQEVVSEKPYDVDSVQNNTDCKFISSGVGGVKKRRRVCLVGLLVIFFYKDSSCWEFVRIRRAVTSFVCIAALLNKVCSGFCCRVCCL